MKSHAIPRSWPVQGLLEFCLRSDDCLPDICSIPWPSGPCLSFRSLRYISVVHAPMSVHGHKHTGSVTQNHKAQLANAYNELGKELSSQKIRIIGNYTLGKVIGEGGSHFVSTSRKPLIRSQEPTERCASEHIASRPPASL